MRCLTIVNEEDEILVTTEKGVIVRQKCSSIPTQSRTATGVMVQKVEVDKGDFISAVSKVPSRVEDEDGEEGDQEGGGVVEGGGE